MEILLLTMGKQLLNKRLLKFSSKGVLPVNTV